LVYFDTTNRRQYYRFKIDPTNPYKIINNTKLWNINIVYGANFPTIIKFKFMSNSGEYVRTYCFSDISKVLISSTATLLGKSYGLDIEFDENGNMCSHGCFI